MKDLPFIALLVLFAVALLLAPATDAGVGLVDEPQIHADHVEIEITTTERAGVRTTATDGAWLWSQWLDDGEGGASLTAQPLGIGRPAGLVWHGKTDSGADHLTFRLVWPGPCPCEVELTAGDDAVRTWNEVTP